MHRFDYSEILGDIPPDIARLMIYIKEIRSREDARRANCRQDYGRLERIARLASVKYSNEIEGIIAPDDRIERIVEHGEYPWNDSEQEIAGYSEALDLINTNANGLKFECGMILHLHSLLDLTDYGGGPFKDVDNVIVSIDRFGRRHIVFEPVPAEETEYHMEQLCQAYAELSTQGYEPLLYIPCVILDFLCIHPFIDGNGRTSRLLTMLLLYREGIDVCRYVSMDEHISLTKPGYYGSLRESSEGWIDNRWTYFPFIRYFLRTLLECYRDLEARFPLADGKDEAIEALHRMSDSGPSGITLEDIDEEIRDHRKGKEGKSTR